MEKFKPIQIYDNQYISTTEGNILYIFELKYVQYVQKYVISQKVLLQLETSDIIDYTSFQNKYIVALTSSQYVNVYYINVSLDNMINNEQNKYTCIQIQQIRLPGYEHLGLNSYYYTYVIENNIYVHGYYTDIIQLSYDEHQQNKFNADIIYYNKNNIVLQLYKVSESNIYFLTVSEQGTILQSLSNSQTIIINNDLNTKISQIKCQHKILSYVENDNLIYIYNTDLQLNNGQPIILSLDKAESSGQKHKVLHYQIQNDVIFVLYESFINMYDFNGKIILSGNYFVNQHLCINTEYQTLQLDNLLQNQIAINYNGSNTFTSDLRCINIENQVEANQIFDVQTLFFFPNKYSQLLKNNSDEDNNYISKSFSFNNEENSQSSSFITTSEIIIKYDQKQDDISCVDAQKQPQCNTLWNQLMVIIDQRGNMYISSIYKQQVDSISFNQLYSSQLNYSHMISLTDGLFVGLQTHKITLYTSIKQFELQKTHIKLSPNNNNIVDDSEQFIKQGNIQLQSILNKQDIQIDIFKTHSLQFYYQNEVYYIDETHDQNIIYKIGQNIEYVSSVNTMLQYVCHTMVTEYFLADLIYLESDQYAIILYCIQLKRYFALYFTFELSEIAPKRVEMLECNIDQMTHNYDRSTHTCYTTELKELYRVVIIQNDINQQCIQVPEQQIVHFEQLNNFYTDNYITILNNVISSNNDKTTRITNGLVVSVEKQIDNRLTNSYVLYTTKKVLYLLVCQDSLQLILVNSNCTGYRITDNWIFFMLQGTENILCIDWYKFNFTDRLQFVYPLKTNLQLSTSDNQRQLDQIFYNIQISEIDNNVFINNCFVFTALQQTQQIQHACIVNDCIDRLKRIRKLQFQISNDAYLFLNLSNSNNSIQYTLYAKKCQIQSLIPNYNGTYILSNIILMQQNQIQAIAVNCKLNDISFYNMKLYILKSQPQDQPCIIKVEIKKDQLKNRPLKHMILFENFQSYYLLLVFVRYGIQLYQLDMKIKDTKPQINDNPSSQLESTQHNKIIAKFISGCSINMYISSVCLLKNCIYIYDKFGQFAIINPQTLEIIKWGNISKIIIDQNIYLTSGKIETKILVDSTGEVIQHRYT